MTRGRGGSGAEVSVNPCNVAYTDIGDIKDIKYFSSHQTLIKATITVCKYTLT